MQGDVSRPPDKLHRTLGFWALAFYGLGDILGAGIYALMGKVAGVAGAQAWLAFLVSLLAATVTALTYSELVTRFPQSGGESLYCERGFGVPLISTVVGWLVFCAGTLSLSAIAVAFAGYMSPWTKSLPDAVVIAVFIAVLGAINFRGIRESSMANILCTTIEASGLLLVFTVGLYSLWHVGPPAQRASPFELASSDGVRVMEGAALAFFAFIGFQDMVNVAEEVKAPERDFPRAILIALGFAGLTYVAVALIATTVVAPSALGESEEPLTLVVRTASNNGLADIFPVIALFAVANTGLLNFVMASRLLYGMAEQRLVPARLSRVHARRRTPHVAIATVLVAALALSLSGTLSYLAGATSTLLLIVFLTVNLALIFVKWRERDRTPDVDGFRVPFAVPVLGVIVTATVIGFAQPTVLLTAGGLIVLGAALYGIRRLARVKTAGPPSAGS